MTEKIRLEKSTFSTVKAMLESEDVENQIVGFECIENSDFKTNLVYILLLFRETNLGTREWTAHAPETSKKLESVFKVPLANASVTFDNIARKMATYKVDQEDFQFYMDRYAEHLKHQFNSNIQGHDEYINSLEIKVTISKYESRTISQDQ